MSRNRDGVRGWRPASGEPHGGELCVARAAGREIAPHERHTLDGEPPELASLAGQQGVGQRRIAPRDAHRSEEHTSELQSRLHLVCRLLLEKKKKKKKEYNKCKVAYR